MMCTHYCYWTIATGSYASSARQLVASARSVGVTQDFHIWSDRQIEGAISHNIPESRIEGRHFKLTYLRDLVQKLDYDHFIWLDADTLFVRDPGDPLAAMRSSPLHLTLESDLTSGEARQSTWCGCSPEILCELMKSQGVRHRSIYSVDPAMFIVHRHFINTLSSLTKSFYFFCKNHGHPFDAGPLLSYAMHMVCGDPERHRLEANRELWCSDTGGVFTNGPSGGHSFNHACPMTQRTVSVNPAMIHLRQGRTMTNKTAT